MDECLSISSVNFAALGVLGFMSIERERLALVKRLASLLESLYLVGRRKVAKRGLWSEILIKAVGDADCVGVSVWRLEISKDDEQRR